MSDPIQDRFERLKEAHDDSDWRDVRRRAYGRRRAVSVGIIGLVALLAAPSIVFGGRLIGFFSPGKPVALSQLAGDDRRMLVTAFCRRVELVTPAGAAPVERCAADNTPTVTEIANNGERAYWRFRYPDGHVCVASGSTAIHRSVFGDHQFGSVGCTQGAAAAWLIPLPEHPITSEVAVSGSPQTGEMKILSISGLAGAGIASVGVLDDAGHAQKTDVQGHIYALESLPDHDWATLVGYDADGRAVYRESLKNPPRPPVSPEKPQQPSLPGSPHELVQHAEVHGAAIDVFASGRVVVHFATQSPPYDFLQAHLGGSDEITVQCGQVAFGAGKWLESGSGVYASFGRTIETTIPSQGSGVVPPYDVCSVRGHYGRRWDEHVGYHNAVEFAFNAAAERFFAEQAPARRLAYFLRSPKVDAIRAALKHGGTAPSSDEIAARFDDSVVALTNRDAIAPPGKVGVWSDGSRSIVATEQAADGRRMWAELDSGHPGRNNLHGLATVF